MNTFGQQLRNCRVRHGYRTAKSFADALKIDAPSVTQWENDKYKPKPPNLLAISDVLDLDLRALLNYVVVENNTDPNVVALSSSRVSMYKYPVFRWDEKRGMIEENKNDYYTSSIVSKDAFALKVIGESMSPEFNEGDTILVERTDIIDHGDYVLLNNANGKHILRKLIIDGDEEILQATNPEWPTRLSRLSDDLNVVGKVIEKKVTY